MTDDRLVWLNGQLVPWSKATVPLLSHALSRASAIFDVFGVYEGPRGPAAFRMDRHLKRLRQSAALLGMELAYSEDEIAAGVSQAVRANRLGRALIKILAFWSEEAVLHLVLKSKLDVAIFAIAPSEELRLDDTTPRTACLSKWRKLHPETVQVAAKACANYLNSYMSRKDAQDRGYDLGFMLGTDGLLAEGSTESVFLVKDGILKTPPLGGILSSISRMTILETAPSVGIRAEETALTADDLLAADEIFASHSGARVMPIGRFDTRDLLAPGPVTAKLIGLMDDIFHFRNPKFNHFFQPLA